MSTSPKKVRVRHFAQAKEQGIKISGLTSYDFLTAGVFDEAGVDFLLVGDSAANVVFGYDTTVPVTVDELIPLARGVAKATTRALVVADLPFGSYEASPDEALHSAIRFMKEAGVHAVKLGQIDPKLRCTSLLFRVSQEKNTKHIRTASETA